MMTNASYLQVIT